LRKSTAYLPVQFGIKTAGIPEAIRKLKPFEKSWRGESTEMDNKWKIILLVALVIYIASPIDLAPGPIDDAILGLIGVIAGRNSLKKS
jgi:uncharacterized membrane protein YkvA (DUF1232 family)